MALQFFSVFKIHVNKSLKEQQVRFKIEDGRDWMSSFIIIDKILSKGNLEVISSSLKFQNRLLPKLTTWVFLFLFKREKRRYHDDMNGAFKFSIIGALEILSSNTSLKYLFATNYPLLKINHQRIFIFLNKLFHI